MSVSYTAVSGVLGVNLEGHEAPPVGELITPAGGAPRIPPGTPVLISGNKVAVYGVAAAQLNPGTTVAFQNFNASGSTIAATTATADNLGVYITLNTTTAATGEYLFARTNTYVGR